MPGIRAGTNTDRRPWCRCCLLYTSALGSGFVVKYSVGVGTAGGGTVDGYSDLKARVIVKRGSTVISEFRDAEFVGVTAGQSYTFDASPYLKDATAYTCLLYTSRCV